MTHLHKYIEIYQDDDGCREICERCKKINVIRKGRAEQIDNESYLKEHALDFLQQGMAGYEEEYGQNTVNSL